MSTKLNDTQLVLLSAAAQRDNRCLVPPQDLKSSAAQKAATKLIAAGLVKEIKARAGTPVWRRDEQAGQSYALRLTVAGAKVISIDEDLASDEASEEVGQREHAAATVAQTKQQVAADTPATGTASSFSTPRSGTKLAQVVELLQRDDGATLGDLIASTGWLPHTTRAVLTGLRKRSFVVAIDRSNLERGSIYRIRTDRTCGAQSASASQVAAQPNQAPALSIVGSKKAERVGASRARRVAQ
jgi:Protein of unknown function (DUF3489)